MPTRSRHADPSVLLPLVAALALAACSTGAEPAECVSDSTCPAASRCQAGVCVAGARPVASIRAPGPVEAFALVHLDGSGSRDPDGPADLAEHLWTVSALGARCAPPVVAGRTAIAPVRFGCAGQYEVSLAVRDVLGLESDRAAIVVDVVPSARPPAVRAGPDVASGHSCGGDPLACRPVERIVLSSTAEPGLALRWTVEPPLDRPLDDGTRRVAFQPDAAAAAPVVAIETDGTAISGDWIFRVEARDAHGVVGAAYTRVSISNRPPVLVADPPAPFPHAFDPLRSAFTSSGTIPWTAFDPDGDPVTVTALLRHVGDGGAAFDGVVAVGPAVAGTARGDVILAVDVPFAVPGDASFLRGGPGLSRTVELVGRDANGADSRTSLPVEIGNRPPEPMGGPVDLVVPHRFDPLRARYVASARVGSWRDPDGDPLFVAPGAAPCDGFSVAGETLSIECGVPYEGIPAVHRLAGRHEVPVRVRDPWSDASAVAIHAIEILNAAPTLSRTVDPPVACVQQIVEPLNFSCHWQFIASPAAFTAHPIVADPDGDPVLVTALPPPGGVAAPTQAVCTAPACTPFGFVQPAIVFPCHAPYSAPSRLRATDGAAAVTVDATPPPSGC